MRALSDSLFRACSGVSPWATGSPRARCHAVRGGPARCCRGSSRGQKGQALSGQGQVAADVGDHEVALVRCALHLQAHGRANGRAPSVGGQYPLRLLFIHARGRVDGECGVRGCLLDPFDLVAPAQFDQRLFTAGLQQIFLKVLLLQVDHWKKAVVFVMRRFHAEHVLAAEVRVAKAPGQAGGADAVGHAHILQNFHAAACEDNRAAALRDL